MNTIGFDHRAITINGVRSLILAGAVQYPRSTPAMWPEILRHSKAAGLNTIETYAFWNLHEARRGVFDFTDRLDLVRFCRCAADLGMHVILRIGPYICAETNYGGFPAWLRDVPGMRMRTYNEPFLQEVQRWVRYLCEYLHPLFAPQGGPIILAQIENEYGIVAKAHGIDADRYLQWCSELARSLNLGIPWIMCLGSAAGTIETINAHYGHWNLPEHWQKHPDQPGLWTEAWLGCYDVWGYAHRSRSATDMAYAAARFFIAGGTGINYYMWHGGTNFGRESMYLQTTSFDFAAVLDEFGLPTTMYHHLARLNRILADYEALLLQDCRPTPVMLGPRQAMYACTDGSHEGTHRDELLFIVNDAQTPAEVTCRGQTYEIAARSVIIADATGVLYDTSQVREDSIVCRSMQPTDTALSFSSWAEPMPGQWPADRQSVTVSHDPLEQLQFTHDQTDYCWYTTSLEVPAEQTRECLTLESVGDVVHVFVDGRLAATTKAPLQEERGRFDGDGYRQVFELRLPAGRHSLSILCCSLGLIKGEWMIGYTNMVEERKGLWGPVRWGERILTDWRIQPGLLGEELQAFGADGRALPWRPVDAAGRLERPCWLRATFRRPGGDTPLALDASGMNKGMAWLNGRCLGRYWLTPGVGLVPDWMRPAIRDERVGEPTQRHYHLPGEWLADNNELVLLEEIGGEPGKVRLCRWR